MRDSRCNCRRSPARQIRRVAETCDPEHAEQTEEKLKGKDYIRVEFETPDAVSPKELGIGDDINRLGICMESMKLIYPENWPVMTGSNDRDNKKEYNNSYLCKKFGYGI